jgi:hypothetical protein
MKTYKQLYQQAMAEKSKLHDQHMKLRQEHWELINSKINLLDTYILNTVVQGLEEIRQNGGSWSKTKAIELLFVLGKL